MIKRIYSEKVQKQIDEAEALVNDYEQMLEKKLNKDRTLSQESKRTLWLRDKGRNKLRMLHCKILELAIPDIIYTEEIL